MRVEKPPIIRFRCSACETINEKELPELSTSTHCNRCGHTQLLSFDPASKNSLQITKCAICGGTEFYANKDFNRALGMAIVVVGALSMLVMIAMGQTAFTAYLPLGIAVILDYAIYHRVPLVQVCYDCDTIYKNFNAPEKAGEFDLATHDAYKYWEKGKKMRSPEEGATSEPVIPLITTHQPKK